MKSLIEFFGNPAKHLIERRLRLRLGQRHDALEAALRGRFERKHLASLRGERRSTIGRFQRLREEYTPAALERLGLLPNYTLLDDGELKQLCYKKPKADAPTSEERTS